MSSQGAKDAPPPRPNKRPRLGPSPAEAASEAVSLKATKSASKAKDEKAAKGKAGKESQIEEFLQVMKPRTKKGPSWADNDALLQPSSSRTPAVATAPDDTRPGAKKKKKEKHDVNAAEETEGTAESDAAAVSDMDWFKQRTKAVLDEPEEVAERAFEQSEDESEEEGDDGDDKVGILFEFACDVMAD